jgi:hypothetical protein
MPFRRTRGIVSIDSSERKDEADMIKQDADVIMTAAALGFAASSIERDRPIQFDMDPLESDEGKRMAFNDAVNKLDKASLPGSPIRPRRRIWPIRPPS